MKTRGRPRRDINTNQFSRRSPSILGFEPRTIIKNIVSTKKKKKKRKEKKNPWQYPLHRAIVSLDNLDLYSETGPLSLGKLNDQKIEFSFFELKLEHLFELVHYNRLN